MSFFGNALACERCPFRAVDVCTRSQKKVIEHVARDYCPHPAGPRFGTSTAPPDWSGVPLVQVGAPQRKPRPAPETIKPVPRDEWPLRVRMVARLRKPEDKGVGDTLARLINTLPAYKGTGAGDAFKAITTRLGIDCGCGQRQARANQLYPY